MPISFEMVKTAIIEPNGIEDVFLHAWHDESKVGQPYNSAQPAQNGRVGFIKPGTAEYLTDAYKPKQALIEPQRDFEHLKSLISAPSANQELLGSNFYSSYMANQMRKIYEAQNGVKYDVVIKTRYDIYYEHHIKVADYLSQIEEGKLVVRKRYQDDQDNFKNPNLPMNDVFAIGNGKAMDIFCGVYPEMTDLNKVINPPFGENYLGQHVRVKNNIQLHKADWTFDILHRVIDLSSV